MDKGKSFVIRTTREEFETQVVITQLSNMCYDT